MVPKFKRVVLWLNPAILPKMMTAHIDYSNKPLGLSALADESVSRPALCQVRALKYFLQETASWWVTDQLFVCFGEVIVPGHLNKDQDVPSSFKCCLTDYMDAFQNAMRVLWQILLIECCVIPIHGLCVVVFSTVASQQKKFLGLLPGWSKGAILRKVHRFSQCMLWFHLVFPVSFYSQKRCGYCKLPIGENGSLSQC